MRMRDPELVGTTIQAYLIPSVDAHQSEYIGDRDRRVRFVTGFSGTGQAIIAEGENAAVWVDSRYHLQAENQLDKQFWTLMKEGIKNFHFNSKTTNE